ncbi:MAG: prolyl aminopeptidase [Burkholderiaceae bacterium]|nr:MAG: prolyl aminopeptidase [Burkholderiaceae bacterium]
MAQDTPLFPEIEPAESGWLDTGEGHQVYWERCGNPAGIPVLFVHGGPGAGCSPTSRRFFDPQAWDIVLVDQRGAGRSTPLGETAHNDTARLIGDFETLRQQLGIRQWMLFGGSWGSTLSLAYAQQHPDKVLGLVLRGIWLGTEAEIDWWLYGIREFFPKEWEAFAQQVPEHERDDLLGAYQRRLSNPEAEIALGAARAWSRYEGSCLHLLPQDDTVAAFESDAVALGVGRLEAHYFAAQAFLSPGQLLAGAAAIRHLPCEIVHGRYDVICPVRQAYALHEAWPGSQLHVIPDAGHASSEPGIMRTLVQATERMKHLLQR